MMSLIVRSSGISARAFLIALDGVSVVCSSPFLNNFKGRKQIKFLINRRARGRRKTKGRNVGCTMGLLQMTRAYRIKLKGCGLCKKPHRARSVKGSRDRNPSGGSRREDASSPNLGFARLSVPDELLDCLRPHQLSQDGQLERRRCNEDDVFLFECRGQKTTRQISAWI